MSEKIVQLNEEVIKGQIKELVRGSVEETLNELLEKEAESLTQAARYERSEARQGYRSGHYDRNLTTTSGRPHRGLAESSLAGRAVSVCLCGRHLPTPQLGRRVRKCCCFGGDRRE